MNSPCRAFIYLSENGQGAMECDRPAGHTGRHEAHLYTQGVASTKRAVQARITWSQR